MCKIGEQAVRNMQIKFTDVTNRGKGSSGKKVKCTPKPKASRKRREKELLLEVTALRRN